MDMKKVKSSAIAEVGHDPQTNTLAVKFHDGKVYHYSDFTADHFAEFQRQESIGSHFARNIVGKFKHRKIEA
jgi:KTSC domain-containing protein